MLFSIQETGFPCPVELCCTYRLEYVCNADDTGLKCAIPPDLTINAQPITGREEVYETLNAPCMFKFKWELTLPNPFRCDFSEASVF